MQYTRAQIHTLSIARAKKYYIGKRLTDNRQITETHKQEIFPYSHGLFEEFYDRLRLIKEWVLLRAGIILDVGCRDGYVLLTIPCSDHLRIGVDVKPEALKNAKTAAKRLKRRDDTEFLLSDAEKLVLREHTVARAGLND